MFQLKFRHIALAASVVILSCIYTQADKPLIDSLLPAAGKGPLRAVINSDVAADITDQFAVTYAMLSARFNIEGLVAAHHGGIRKNGKPDIELSYQELRRILRLMGGEKVVPLKRGAPEPLQDRAKPQEAEGIDFIIERALARSSAPLYIIALGPLTDVASAYLKRPEIKKKVIVLWHGGSNWPQSAKSLNSGNDLKAVQVVFDSDLRLILGDAGAEMALPIEEARERLIALGPLGQYLFSLRALPKPDGSPRFSEYKTINELATIGVAINRDWGVFEEAEAPVVADNFEYSFPAGRRKLLRLKLAQRNAIFNDFYIKLMKFATSGGMQTTSN